MAELLSNRQETDAPPEAVVNYWAADQVLALIDELKARTTASFVVVTHDAAIAAHMDRVLELRDGSLHSSGGGHAGG